MSTDEHGDNDGGWLSTRNKKKVTPSSKKPGGVVRWMSRRNAISPFLTLLEDNPPQVTANCKQSAISDFFLPRLKPLEHLDHTMPHGQFNQHGHQQAEVSEDHDSEMYSDFAVPFSGTSPQSAMDSNLSDQYSTASQSVHGDANLSTDGASVVSSQAMSKSCRQGRFSFSGQKQALQYAASEGQSSQAVSETRGKRKQSSSLGQGVTQPQLDSRYSDTLSQASPRIQSQSYLSEPEICSQERLGAKPSFSNDPSVVSMKSLPQLEEDSTSVQSIDYVQSTVTSSPNQLPAMEIDPPQIFTSSTDIVPDSISFPPESSGGASFDPAISNSKQKRNGESLCQPLADDKEERNTENEADKKSKYTKLKGVTDDLEPNDTEVMDSLQTPVFLRGGYIDSDSEPDTLPQLRATTKNKRLCRSNTVSGNALNMQVKKISPEKRKVKKSSPEQREVKKISPEQREVKNSSLNQREVKKTSPEQREVKKSSPNQREVKQISLNQREETEDVSSSQSSDLQSSQKQQSSLELNLHHNTDSEDPDQPFNDSLLTPSFSDSQEDSWQEIIDRAANRNLRKRKRSSISSNFKQKVVIKDNLQTPAFLNRVFEDG